MKLCIEIRSYYFWVRTLTNFVELSVFRTLTFCISSNFYLFISLLHLFSSFFLNQNWSFSLGLRGLSAFGNLDYWCCYCCIQFIVSFYLNNMILNLYGHCRFALFWNEIFGAFWNSMNFFLLKNLWKALELCSFTLLEFIILHC